MPAGNKYHFYFGKKVGYLPFRQFQDLVDQAAEITGYEAGIADNNGYVIACSDSNKTGTYNESISKAVQSAEAFSLHKDMACLKIPEKGKAEYIAFIAFISSDNVETRDLPPDPALLSTPLLHNKFMPNCTGEITKYLKLMSVGLSAIKSVSEEKTDRNSFIKSIITDNILPGDIYIKARELHLDPDAPRVAFCIKIKTLKQGNTNLYDVLNNLFPNKTKDFVIMIDDSMAALIKELKSTGVRRQPQGTAAGTPGQALPQVYAAEIRRTAETITDMIMTELMVAAVIGIGTEVSDIRDAGRSFKEAQTAIQIGSIFESEKNIVNYNKLGIGRLIYQLPITLCKLFLKEVFRDKPLEEFDSETILTIKKFYENNLNVSEASRQLYIHRNTLIYRLEKIERQTGLDLKRFEDAIILKVAMMVRRYLDSCEK